MGAVAAASGTVTEAVSTTVAYFRNVSQIKNKPVKSDSDSEDALPYHQTNNSFTRIESKEIVTRALGYSSNHLATIAYQMASKSLASSPTARRKRLAKSKTWSSVSKAVEERRTTSRNEVLFGRKEEHGRVHDVASETGHFVDAMLDIGLKG